MLGDTPVIYLYFRLCQVIIYLYFSMYIYSMERTRVITLGSQNTWLTCSYCHFWWTRQQAVCPSKGVKDLDLQETGLPTILNRGTLPCLLTCTAKYNFLSFFQVEMSMISDHQVLWVPKISTSCVPARLNLTISSSNWTLSIAATVDFRQWAHVGKVPHAEYSSFILGQSA